MPPIKSVNLDNGLEIITPGNLANISIATIEIEGRLAGVAGNLKKKEEKFNEWLNNQEPFVIRKPLSDYPPEDSMTSSETVDGNEVIIRIFHVAVHILEINPLKVTVMCSDFPIGGDWWL